MKYSPIALLAIGVISCSSDPADRATPRDPVVREMPAVADFIDFDSLSDLREGESVIVFVDVFGNTPATIIEITREEARVRCASSSETDQTALINLQASRRAIELVENVEAREINRPVTLHAQAIDIYLIVGTGSDRLTRIYDYQAVLATESASRQGGYNLTAVGTDNPAIELARFVDRVEQRRQECR